MIYTFKDVLNTGIYQESDILFVVGQHSIFNNLAIDTVKELCKPKQEEAEDNTLTLDILGDEIGEISGNIVNFDEFTSIVNTVSFYGIWFCSVDYAFMSKKQLNWLESYTKSPSSNAKLVVYCQEYKVYRMLLKNKVIRSSPNINLINLNFTNRTTLKYIVSGLFYKRGITVDEKGIELFILRMSESYDEYEEIIEKIINENAGKDRLSYDDILTSMKGIDNYVFDDLIEKLLEPVTSTKVTKRAKIYKMIKALVDEIGPRQLVNKLILKISDYIEFRLEINRGNIPIKVKFSVSEAKQRLGDDNRLSKMSDYTFRKMANIASKTSLKDWLWMKMILMNMADKFMNESYEMALYSISIRTIMDISRINNDIGIENILEEELNRLDNIIKEDLA